MNTNNSTNTNPENCPKDLNANSDVQSQSPKNERILNLIIVDESGSMQSIYKQALDGMNTTIARIKSQAQEIEGVSQYINLITFDSGHYSQHLRHCPAAEAEPLRPEQYCPRGCTPLFDAIGRAVTSLERHTTENDGVMVTIITDGYENDSREFTGGEIKRLIERLSTKGWMFTYIGANQDAMYEAGKIGIRHALNFEATPEGTEEMWEKEHRARASMMARINGLLGKKFSIFEAFSSEAANDANYFDNTDEGLWNK